MLKKEARKLYREKRMALSEKERTMLDDLLLIQFQTADLPFITSLLSYWPIEENHEPATHLFTEFLRFRNPELKACYPVADFSTGKMFHYWLLMKPDSGLDMVKVFMINTSPVAGLIA
jgi:5-formyltetrahydrofolate cyclo-ligase